jgi:hypothetical protein
VVWYVCLAVLAVLGQFQSDRYLELWKSRDLNYCDLLYRYQVFLAPDNILKELHPTVGLRRTIQLSYKDEKCGFK